MSNHTTKSAKIKPDDRKSRGPKPEKPYPEFPLTAHKNGKWCKMIRPLGGGPRKMFYFGTWDDPDAALKQYEAEVNQIKAGRQPVRLEGGLPLIEGATRYLARQEKAFKRGDIKKRTWDDCQDTVAKIVAFFGPDRIVESLTPLDFEMFRDSFYARSRKSPFSGQVAPKTILNRIARARSVFKYFYDARLIPHPVDYGESFSPPGRREKKKWKAQVGKRMFSADEVRRLLDAANPTLRVWILLAINCGYGPTDLGHLPISAIDFVHGFLEFPRVKTYEERRAWLWPETTAALRHYLDHVRPDPLPSEPSGLVFVSRLGTVYRDHGKNHPVTTQFARLQKNLGIQATRRGSGIYWLRHTFETISGRALDQVATNYVMGHVDATMAGEYREEVEDWRIRKVCAHVRRWLWPDAGEVGDDPPADDEPVILKFAQ